MSMCTLFTGVRTSPTSSYARAFTPCSSERVFDLTAARSRACSSIRTSRTALPRSCSGDRGISTLAGAAEVG